MRIETQLAANGSIMHFITEDKLPISGAVEFDDAKSLRKSPLAESLFDLGGIESILITPDFISVTKNASAGWEDLKPQILAEIIDYLASGQEIIPGGDKPDAGEVVNNIKGLLSARVRPIIQKDGGDIEFMGFEKGVVYVKLSGKCVGCPHTHRTLKDGVEKILRTYVKEVVSVEKVN